MKANDSGCAPAYEKQAENHIADLLKAADEGRNSNRCEEHRPPFAYGNTKAPEQEENSNSSEKKCKNNDTSTFSSHNA